MDEAWRAVDSAARSLIGSELGEVRYYEIPFGLAIVRPWERDVAHVTDYGVDLVTDRGTVGITWTQYGSYGYGLDIISCPILEVRSNDVQISYVEDAPPWNELSGQVIDGFELHWHRVTWTGQEPVTAPFAVVIRLANGKHVAFVCGSWNGPDQPVFPTGDDIVVIWKPGPLSILVPDLPKGLLG